MSDQESKYSWLDGAVQPAAMSFGYRAGLFSVAVAMLLLPAVYVALCLGVGYGVYWYATNETFLLNAHQPGLVAYFGVILAGCIGLVFMIKPLFSRQKKIMAHLPITHDTEPELLRFIEETCDRIGAPRPVRVFVDNHANASASFENGISGFLRNRLVLTIGLPLVGGLTIAQFGGVLAHEFGHFTQAAAMRLNFVIRGTNHWFNRVIYERDDFDARLARWTKRGNIYWIAMAWMAVGFIWLARKVLRGLMLLGHAVSANMMRQMEYDADHYEEQLAGTENFRDVFFRLRLIGFGSQIAQNHLQETWKHGQLVTNVPLLTRSFTTSLPAAQLQAFSTAFAGEKNQAKWYATHPTDYQRRSRRTVSAPGILQGDAGADILFADFQSLAEKLTLIDYSERFRLKFQAENLIPTEDYLVRVKTREDRLKNMSAFFAGLIADNRFLFPGHSEAGEPGAAQKRLAEIGQALADQASLLAETGLKIGAARARRANALKAQALHAIGIKIKPAAFQLPDLKNSTIEAIDSTSTKEISALEGNLAPFIAMTEEKLDLACLEAMSHSVDAAAAERIGVLRRFLSAIRPIDRILNGCRRSFFVASVCVDHYQVAKDKKRLERFFSRFSAEFTKAATEIEKIASQIGYPLQGKETHPHLSAYFLAGSKEIKATGHYRVLKMIYERYAEIYLEVVFELLDYLEPGAGQVASAPAMDIADVGNA